MDIEGFDLEAYLKRTAGHGASSGLRGLTKADTRVFWDIEDFPLPTDRTINSMPIKVEASLFRETFRGDLSFWVYTRKKSQRSLDHLRYLRFTLGEHSDDKAKRLYTMLMDMVFWAHQNPPANTEKEINLMVIAKDLPKEKGETKFVATLEELKKRGYNVFLVVPDDITTVEQAPFPDATIVWHWSKLLDGQEGSFGEDPDSDSEEESSHGEKRPKISDDAAHHCDNKPMCV